MTQPDDRLVPPWQNLDCLHAVYDTLAHAADAMP
jgi:hypothetical protein